MKKVLTTLLAISCLTGTLSGCLSSTGSSSQIQTESSSSTVSTQSDAKVIKVSFAGSENHPIMKTLLQFESMVEERTEGRYDIQLYPNGVLGDDLKATDQVKAGVLDAVVTSPSPIGSTVKEIMVFDLPYIFTSEEEADEVLAGPFADYLDEKMKESGLINVAWYEDGFRHLTNSVRPVLTPDDVKGLKIRTMENPIHLAIWQKLGANPTPMAYTDVFTALQQHVIDGQENPFPSINDGKFQEVQKYLSTTGHVYSPFVFVFNPKTLDSIPEADRDIILQAAKDTEPINRKLNRDASKATREEMEKSGLAIIDLSVEQKKAFQEILKPIWDEFTNIYGEDALSQLKEALAAL
ncbi:MAG: DctP family TRAP transporter solute-binding subunit [Ruminococcaceae bacterium]|nr:DctP family TRAP transporter solute-binding subunit [Oscillospiraceae bacterium]